MKLNHQPEKYSENINQSDIILWCHQNTGWPHNFHKKIPGLFKENHSFFKDNFKG